MLQWLTIDPLIAHHRSHNNPTLMLPWPTIDPTLVYYWSYNSLHSIHNRSLIGCTLSYLWWHSDLSLVTQWLVTGDTVACHLVTQWLVTWWPTGYFQVPCFSLNVKVLPEDPVQLTSSSSSCQTASNLGRQVNLVLVERGHPGKDTGCVQPFPSILVWCGIVVSGGWSVSSWAGSSKSSKLSAPRALSSTWTPAVVPTVRGNLEGTVSPVPPDTGVLMSVHRADDCRGWS